LFAAGSPDVSGACLYDGPKYLAHFEDRKVADAIVSKYHATQELLELCETAAKKIRRRGPDRDMELLVEHLEAALLKSATIPPGA
jgi:hypothetical protein